MRRVKVYSRASIQPQEVKRHPAMIKNRSGIFVPVMATIRPTAMGSVKTTYTAGYLLVERQISTRLRCSYTLFELT